MSALPAYKRELRRAEWEAAHEAGIDVLVAVYHSDHRELCAHERDRPFGIVNVLEVLGAAMGLQQSDRQMKVSFALSQYRWRARRSSTRRIHFAAT